VRRDGLAAALAAALVGCAQVPPASDPVRDSPRAPRAQAPAADDAPRQAAIARHGKLAASARAAGDLPLAAEHYAVLVLIDAGNPAHGEALRTTQVVIAEGVQEQLRIAAAARKAGDAAKAREAWLRVLVLDPSNAEAARALREAEQQAMARTQADRAARARSMDDIVASARVRASADNGVADLEQRIELVRSSDASIALREARAWAEANPGDRAGRARLAAALAERARDLEAKGQREWALPLYEQAVTMGGAAQAEAGKRAAALRRALADEAYADGMRARSKDLAAAIRHWETALRYEPQHARANDRLREARAAQQKLEKIGK
jgi:tetratricopeptide (TPR) repeat protein